MGIKDVSMKHILRNLLGAKKPTIPQHSGHETHPEITDHPLLSIIVIVYDMPKQAFKTLFSLSTAYQHQAIAEEYEIIVVENRSTHLLNKDDVEAIDTNIRYFLREETEPTPVHAINFGVTQAKGNLVAIIIDGARMATPGLIKNILLANKLSTNPVICVPGYHLGHKLQAQSALEGYDNAAEEILLSSIKWPDDGYRLFDIACLGGSLKDGFFLPMAESNCLAIKKSLFTELEGYHPSFNSHGGGYANLDMYRRACEHSGTELIVLFGEGTFHQIHGGVTTGGSQQNRKALLDELTSQYKSIRQRDYEVPYKPATYLGNLSKPAMHFVGFSAQKALEILT